MERGRGVDLKSDKESMLSTPAPSAQLLGAALPTSFLYSPATRAATASGPSSRREFRRAPQARASPRCPSVGLDRDLDLHLRGFVDLGGPAGCGRVVERAARKEIEKQHNGITQDTAPSPAYRQRCGRRLMQEQHTEVARCAAARLPVIAQTITSVQCSTSTSASGRNELLEQPGSVIRRPEG
jgi:hypothetical protein